jgi:hypothetical protein
MSNSHPIALVVGKTVSNDAGLNIYPKESPDVTIVDEEALSLKVVNLREDPEARQAFLSGFSAEESKEILNKVDKRFFILIGLMFLIKNVCLFLTSIQLRKCAV